MKGSIYKQLIFRDISFSLDNLCVRNFVFYVFTTIPVLPLCKKLFDS